MILPNTDLDGAQVVADAVRRAVQALIVRLPDGTSIDVDVLGLARAGRVESSTLR